MYPIVFLMLFGSKYRDAKAVRSRTQAVYVRPWASLLRAKREVLGLWVANNEGAKIPGSRDENNFAHRGVKDI